MKSEKGIILGIDTSCDDTSVSLVKEGKKILSSLVSSQVSLHSPYGGVIPELASRAHIERIGVIILESLKEANLRFKDIEGIGVTKGPGLPGSLLVGVEVGKALSMALGIPIVGINHLEAHLYSPFLTSSGIQFPVVGLVASGGHTLLAFSPYPYHFFLLGQTRDDACGEALDKVARFLGLGYPGGPELERLASQGDSSRYSFPTRILPDSFDFSFSGLKTAVIRLMKREKVKKEDLAASFQECIVEILVEKTFYAAKEKKARSIIIGGGVISNQRLRERMLARSRQEKVPIYIPPPSLCTDNAAMVAGLAYWRIKEGRVDSLEMDISPNFSLPHE